MSLICIARYKNVYKVNVYEILMILPICEELLRKNILNWVNAWKYLNRIHNTCNCVCHVFTAIFKNKTQQP